MKKSLGFKIFKHTFIILFVFITLMPFFWTISTSFKTKIETTAWPPSLFPNAFTLENYTTLFSIYGYQTYIGNSLLLTAATVAVTLLCAMFGGYAASRFRFKGKETIMFFILMGMALGRFANAMPLYFLATDLGIYNTYFVLILAYSAFITPLVTWLMRAYYNTLPYSIEEAAKLDGCNSWTAFWRVIVPIVKPSIIAGGVIAATSAWNEYILTLNLTNTTPMRTLPIALSLLETDLGVDWGLLSAGSVLSIIPILIIFLVLQKYFVQGLVAGSISAS